MIFSAQGGGLEEEEPRGLPQLQCLCIASHGENELCFPWGKHSFQHCSGYTDRVCVNNSVRRSYQGMKSLLHPECIGIDSFSWEMCSHLALNPFTSPSICTEHPHQKLLFFPNVFLLLHEFLCRFAITEGPESYNELLQPTPLQKRVVKYPLTSRLANLSSYSKQTRLAMCNQILIFTYELNVAGVYKSGDMLSLWQFHIPGYSHTEQGVNPYFRFHLNFQTREEFSA